jgi:hypothetical protein
MKEKGKSKKEEGRRMKKSPRMKESTRMNEARMCA